MVVELNKKMEANVMLLISHAKAETSGQATCLAYFVAWPAWLASLTYILHCKSPCMVTGVLLMCIYSYYVDTAPRSVVHSNGQQFSQLIISSLNGK